MQAVGVRKFSLPDGTNPEETAVYKNPFNESDGSQSSADETTSTMMTNQMSEVDSREDRDVPVIVIVEGFCKSIVNSSVFTTLMLMIITLAAVVQGLQTDSSYDNNSTLKMLESLITWSFLAEILLKVVATIRRPYRFFLAYSYTRRGKKQTNIDWWNVFDLIVVILSFVQINAIAVLRLIRLLRLLKFVRALPDLQLLIFGVMDSMQSIFYIVLLMVLMFYLFGVIGVVLYETTSPVGCDRDFNSSAPPRPYPECNYHVNDLPGMQQDDYFGDLGRAMIAMFTMALKASWTEIMLPRIFRCNTGTVDEYSWPLCTTTTADTWIGLVYFVIFIFVSSITLVNLVVGVMSQSMGEQRRLQRKEQVGASRRAELPSRMRRAMNRKERRLKSSFPTKLLVKAHIIPAFDSSKSRFDFHQREMLRALDDHTDKLQLLRDAIAWTELPHKEERLDFSLRTILGPPRPPAPKKKKKKKGPAPVRKPAPPRPTDETPFYKRCPLRQGIRGHGKDMKRIQIFFVWLFNFFAWLCNSFFFQTVGVLLVLLAAVVIGGTTIDSMTGNPFLAYGDTIVTWGFFAELACKLLACGMCPWGLIFLTWNPIFVIDWWNILDGVVVIGGFLNIDAIAVLRVFRLFRLLKLVRAIPSLASVLLQLFATLQSLVWVFGLFLMMIYIYSVGGVFLFSDVDPVHFANLGLSFITMLQVSTGDHWEFVIYTVLQGCDNKDLYSDHSIFVYPDEICTGGKADYWIGVVFFLTFILFVYIAVLKLVLGMIITASRQYAENLKKDITVTKMLTEAGLPLHDDNAEGIPHVVLPLDQMMRLTAAVDFVQKNHIWQIYRLWTAHVAPLYVSKSIMNPEKQTATRLQIVPQQIDLTEGIENPISPPLLRGKRAANFRLSALAVRMGYMSSRHIARGAAVLAPAFFDYIDSSRLDTAVIEAHRIGLKERKKRELFAQILSGKALTKEQEKEIEWIEESEHRPMDVNEDLPDFLKLSKSAAAAAGGGGISGDRRRESVMMSDENDTLGDAAMFLQSEAANLFANAGANMGDALSWLNNDPLKANEAMNKLTGAIDVKNLGNLANVEENFANMKNNFAAGVATDAARNLMGNTKKDFELLVADVGGMADLESGLAKFKFDGLMQARKDALGGRRVDSFDFGKMFNKQSKEELRRKNSGKKEEEIEDVEEEEHDIEIDDEQVRFDDVESFEEYEEGDDGWKKSTREVADDSVMMRF